MGTLFRGAKQEESPILAQLYSISSDGVADYIWTKMAGLGEAILDVGARRYAQEDSAFSYKNCLIADQDGTVIGMMVGFPMHVDGNCEPESDPVLAPYDTLEVDNSFYVCGIAVLPEHRKRGLGEALMNKAEEKAKALGYTKLSAIVFEQNPAFRLWSRMGFYEIDRQAIFPHPLIHYTGDAILMVKDLS